MGKALFLGLSAAFFIGYSAVASALLVDSSSIAPIADVTSQECESPSGILLPGDPCYEAEARNVPFIGGLLAGLSNIVEVATNLFSGFGQLITFQAGLPGASMVTAIIFVPLGFVNAFIIYTAIRSGD